MTFTVYSEIPMEIGFNCIAGPDSVRNSTSSIHRTPSVGAGPGRTGVAHPSATVVTVLPMAMRALG